MLTALTAAALSSVITLAPTVAPETPTGAAAVATQPQPAPEPTAPRGPVPKDYPFDEDYSVFSDPALRTTAWSRLKYVPFGQDGYLTFGGESRTRLEYRGEARFGRGPQDDNGDLEQRFRLWADAHISPNLRVFAELKSGLQADNDAPPGPSDEKRIDVHQAFVETRFPAGDGAVSLRVGRQEIGFGAFRLFDMRDGLNVRRSFDAARLRYVSPTWDAEAFAGYAQNERLEEFDNGMNQDYAFWGLRAARVVPGLVPGGRLEGLWIHTDRALAVYDSGAAPEQRDTFSARLNGTAHRIDYDLELVGQTGDWGGRGIRAGYVAASAAYALNGTAKPKLGLRFERATGDDDPTDGKMGTFSQLFGRPVTLNGELGRANLTLFGPTLTLQPTPKLALDGSVSGLWRTSDHDGLYQGSAAVLRGGAEGTSREVGVRYTAGTRYAVSPFWTLGAYVNRVQAGDFLEQTGDGKDLTYATLYTTFRF